MTYEFTECDTCAAKPGTPPLCKGCLKNRDAISDANMRDARVVEAVEKLASNLIDRDTNFGMNESYRTAIGDVLAILRNEKNDLIDPKTLKV